VPRDPGHCQSLDPIRPRTFKSARDFVYCRPRRVDIVHHNDASVDVSRCFERPCKIALSLAPREACLAGRVFAAPQEWPGDRSAELFRNEFRLIETTDALARAVQRDGHDDCALEVMTVEALLQDAAERPGERNTIRILQVVDDFTQCMREE